MKLGEPDASGRPRPMPIEGSEFLAEADTIIASISQQPDFRGLEQVRNEKGWISIDDKNQTSLDGVFAGGDVTNQLGLVTEAIGLGKKAAESIDAYLRGTEPQQVTPPTVIRASGMKLDSEKYQTLPRNEAPVLSVSERVDNFDAMTSSLTEPQLMAETQRCLSCGKCFSCDVCFSFCQENAIKIAPEGSDLKYEFHLNLCTGCKKCGEECPCGFVDLV
jgi:ferredoxin